MPSSTNLVAAKKAILSALTTLPGLEDVNVAYSYSGKDHGSNRELIYFGDRCEGSMSAAAMAGGARYTRQENLPVQLHCVVVHYGEETTETVESRAVEIGAVVEEYLAGNWKLNDMPGLLKASITTLVLESDINDEAAAAVLTYTIQLESHVR
jgi:hypothetical protein